MNCSWILGSMKLDQVRSQQLQAQSVPEKQKNQIYPIDRKISRFQKSILVKTFTVSIETLSIPQRSSLGLIQVPVDNAKKEYI